MVDADFGFEPIARETVSTKIRAQLLRRITTGELAPGAQIPSERDLAEQFQVARTSVREAMQGLVSLGVIDRRGNRSYVAEHLPEVILDGGDNPDKAFVRQLFETRRVLENPIFAMAAARASEAERRAVCDLAARFTPDMDIAAFRDLDREFHTTVAAACGNPLLIELYGKVLDQLFRSREFHALLGHHGNREVVQQIIAESGTAHRQIAAAMEFADVAAMEGAAGRHLGEVERVMVDELV